MGSLADTVKNVNRIGIYHSLVAQIIIYFGYVVQIFLQQALFVTKGKENI